MKNDYTVKVDARVLIFTGVIVVSFLTALFLMKGHPDTPTEVEPQMVQVRKSVFELCTEKGGVPISEWPHTILSRCDFPYKEPPF